MDNGKINKHVLKSIDKTEDWLTESLREEGYPQLHDIVYAEWSGIRGFFIKTHKN